MPDKGCDIATGIVEGQKFTRAGGGKPGLMTYADLEACQPIERAPIKGSYRGYEIRAMSPPLSGGLTMIQILKMLERFPIGDKATGFGAPNTMTVMADAMRTGFADRSIWMGDADFVNVPDRGLLDATYAGLRGAPILPTAQLTPSPVPGAANAYQTAVLDNGKRFASAEIVNGTGETTTHFSVVDKHGNMVSYTSTIESSHGIGVFAGYTKSDGTFKSHGFLLNNELTD